MASHDHYYNILLNQYCSLSHLTITIMEILPPKSLPNKLLGSMSLVLFLISYFVAPPLMGFFLCAYVSVGVWWVCTLCVHGVVCVCCVHVLCVRAHARNDPYLNKLASLFLLQYKGVFHEGYKRHCLHVHIVLPCTETGTTAYPQQQ